MKIICALAILLLLAIAAPGFVIDPAVHHEHNFLKHDPAYAGR